MINNLYLVFVYVNHCKTQAKTSKFHFLLKQNSPSQDCQELLTAYFTNLKTHLSSKLLV